jgi:hypothetical protein
LYVDLYCQRGEAEKRIKKAQLGGFATRTSCQHFQTNQVRGRYLDTVVRTVQ